MLLRVPDFFHQFHCIADQCTDTCCVGWEIDIDPGTLQKYRLLAQGTQKQKNDFGRKILENIEDGHFKLLPGDRCPFLKIDGLCEMICNLGCNGTDHDESGESVLCAICREHPRFVEVYGDIMEKGLGLCCEEAARLLLTAGHLEIGAQSKGEVLNLVVSEIDEPPDAMPEGAEEARDAIFQERDRIFDLLSDRSLPLNLRLINVIDFVESVNKNDFQNDSTEGGIFENDKERLESSTANEPPELSGDKLKRSWIEILGEGESFGPVWDNAYRRILDKGWPKESPPEIFSDEDGERIVAYLIFRYYAKSLFDGDSISKAQFAIFFWIILRQFGMELAAGGAPLEANSRNSGATLIPAHHHKLTAKINAIKLLSKQTEYSDEVMEILTDNFYGNPAFTLEQFRRFLQDM